MVKGLYVGRGKTQAVFDFLVSENRSELKNLVAQKPLRCLVKIMAKLLRGIGCGLVALLAGCSTVSKTKNTSKTFSTVVVDAGHGGKDSGAYRRTGPAEKIVALDVARRLERKLRESQLKTVMTRSSDVFIPLEQRVAIENSQKNAIFVSIHFNDSRRRGIKGF